MNEARPSGVSRFDLICDFFIDRNNEWATIDEIAASGIPPATVTQILYIAKAREFVRLRTDRRGPQKFRLKHV